MSSWDDTTLAEVVTLQRGHDLPTTSRGTGTVPVIGSFGITGYHDVAKYSGPGVAIGRSGASIGVATYCRDDYWPLNTCLFVKDFKGNAPRWVYYLLDSIDFSGYNSGSAQPSLNRNYLAHIPVGLPPFDEQQGIAAVLGAVDDKIESNRRAYAISLSLLDLMAQQTEESLPAVPLSSLVSLDKQNANPAKLLDEAVDHYSLPAFDEGGLAEHVAPLTIMSNKTLVRTKSVLISRLNPRIERFWWVTPSKGFPALASTEFAVLSAGSELELAGAWLAVRSPMFREVLPMRVTGTSGSHQRVRPEDLLAIKCQTQRGSRKIRRRLLCLSLPASSRLAKRSPSWKPSAMHSCPN